MCQHYLTTRSGEIVARLIGDELVVLGIPEHKMTYVGPIGPQGEDVVDAPKGQAARFVHWQLLPNKDQIRVGDRGTTDWFEQRQIQQRARDLVQRRVVNQTFGPNCEHIHTYIAKGTPYSPQLRTAAGIAVAVAIIGLWGGFGQG
jgi:hypothetical protein